MKRKIVWLIAGILCLGLLGNRVMPAVSGTVEQVQAEEYHYPIEETKKVAELDENHRDGQEVYYTLDSSNYTAMVGTSDYRSCGYKGVNNGICIIPEKVSFNGQEYTVTEVYSKAFYSNSKLVALVLPDTVKRVEQYAFSFSTVQYIYIGTGAIEISQWAFHFCEHLREIRVAKGNPRYLDLDGVLYTSDMKSLYCNPALKEGSCLATYEVPESVEKIGDYAFAYAKYRCVELPASCTDIGAYAFDQTDYLEEITLPGAECIHSFAFRACNSLRYINLPDSDYIVERYSFREISSLENLYLKKGVIFPASEPAFKDCRH